MSTHRLVCLAVASAACAGLANPAFAFDARHHSQYPAVTYSASVHPMVSIGTPGTSQTRANVLYVAPVIPTLLGIRAAPVGQPVIYVIDQVDEPALPRQSRNGSQSAETSESGPRILRLEP